MRKPSPHPRGCLMPGCSFVTRSTSGICAACQTVDPRLMASNLPQAPRNPTQTGIAQAAPANAVPEANPPETVYPIGGWRALVSDLSSLLGIATLIVLIWLLAEVAR